MTSKYGDFQVGVRVDDGPAEYWCVTTDPYSDYATFRVDVIMSTPMYGVVSFVAHDNHYGGPWANEVYDVLETILWTRGLIVDYRAIVDINGDEMVVGTARDKVHGSGEHLARRVLGLELDNG